MPKYRKFADGGETTEMSPRPYSALEELASGADKGSFDEDTYARARRFLERGGSEAPKAAAARPRVTVPPSGTPGGAYRGQRAEVPAPKAASAEIPKSAASQSSRAVIPGGGQETEVETPTSASRMREGMSDTAKKALTAIGPLSMIGLGVGYKAYKASDAAKRAQIARAIREGAESAPVTGGSTAARATSETGRRFGPKAEMEAAESTMRGAVGRKDIQAKRAAAAKGRAETMEANKPVMQATPKKASPRARTRDEDTDYELRAKGGRIGYASGGKVRGGGCEMRGKTRGVMR